MIYNINIDREVILCDFVSLIWSKMKYTSTKISKIRFVGNGRKRSNQIRE